MEKEDENMKSMNNRPVISKDDEWLEETEWDDWNFAK